MYKRGLKIGGGVILALVLTTFSIDATDTLSGKGGTLLAQLAGVGAAVCPAGMIQVPGALTFSCVDAYEASAQNCFVPLPQNELDTEINISRSECAPISQLGATPWRFVDREQASILCTRAGKRLPSASEWYEFTLGTPKGECNTSTGLLAVSGKFPSCKSAAGVVDGIGNVWEWVRDDVIDGVYQGRNLPVTGYVTQVDAGGVATVTQGEVVSSDTLSGYFWASPVGAYGIIRGGFYGSKDDSGSHTLHAGTLPTFNGAAVGFRCVK